MKWVEYTTPYDYEGGCLVRKAMRNGNGANIVHITYTYNESGAIIKIEIIARHDGLIPVK